MKKTLFILASVFSFFQLNAQNETDVLNMSQHFMGGTARGTGLSGAYGALGGDLTSLSINPAGIGVYRSSEIVFSPGFTFTDTKSKYYGKSYTDFKVTQNLGNLGIVLNYTSQKEIGLVGVSFGFAYNKLVDFNRNVNIIGNSPYSTYLDEFVTIANIAIDENRNQDPFYEDIAIKANAIYLDGGYYKFGDWDTNGFANKKQQRIINQRGNVGEYDFSFGLNFSNLFYFGATLGIQNVKYSEKKIHKETDLPDSQLGSFNFNDDFNYTGTGYNLKLGVIIKPISLVRLGVALHTPTFYTLSSTWSTNMQTYFKSGYTQYNANEYSNESIYDFSVYSPLKGVFSAAVQGKLGLISVDYEVQNYGWARIRGEDNSFEPENSNISEIYRTTGNLKVGGELKLYKFALRAGYGYYGSPYSTNHFNKNASTQTYSAGFGYRGESMFVDFGYIMLNTNYQYKLYSYDLWENNQWNTYDEFADMETNMNRFVVTVGFRF